MIVWGGPPYVHGFTRLTTTGAGEQIGFHYTDHTEVRGQRSAGVSANGLQVMNRLSATEAIQTQILKLTAQTYRWKSLYMVPLYTDSQQHAGWAL